MILVIDIGNTNIKLGLYDKDDLLFSWRLSVGVPRTADELGIAMQDLFASKNISFTDIKGIICSSVMPSLNYTVEHACMYYMNLKPMMVGPGIKTSINIKYKNPQEVGADRIVNSVAAYKLYGGPCIIVDFGTATTFNVLSEKGEFLGGLIAPGIKSSLDSLIHNASKLTRVELTKPATIIGTTTSANIQAGTIFGFTGLVKYIVEEIKKETGLYNAKVVATGGLSEIVIDANPNIIDISDRYLTLKGLKIIYDNNCGGQNE